MASAAQRSRADSHPSNNAPEKAPSSTAADPGLFTFFDSPSPEHTEFADIKEPRSSRYSRKSMVPAPLRSRTPSPEKPFGHSYYAPGNDSNAPPLPSVAAIDEAERASLPFGASYYAPNDKRIGNDFDAEASLHDERDSIDSIPRKSLPVHTNVAQGIVHPRRRVDSVLDLDSMTRRTASIASSGALPAEERAELAVQNMPEQTHQVRQRPFIHMENGAYVPVPVHDEEARQLPPVPGPMAAGPPAHLPMFNAQPAYPEPAKRKFFTQKRVLIGLLGLFTVFAVIIFIVNMVLDSKAAKAYDAQQSYWQ